MTRDATGDIHPTVLDFGIARVMNTSTPRLTMTATIVGTPLYLSPEQARGERTIDTRSDQYSLAVILYEAITGTAPASGETVFEVIMRVAHGEFLPPRALVADLPEEIERVILRALSLSPENRYPAVADLGAALLPHASRRSRERWAGVFDGRPAAIPTLGQPRLTTFDRGVLEASATQMAGAQSAPGPRAASRSMSAGPGPGVDTHPVRHAGGHFDRVMVVLATAVTLAAGISYFVFRDSPAADSRAS